MALGVELVQTAVRAPLAGEPVRSAGLLHAKILRALRRKTQTPVEEAASWCEAAESRSGPLPWL